MSEPGTDLETALKRFAAWKHYRATGAVQWENDELKDGMLIFEAYAALEARCRELEGLLSRLNNCWGADFKRIAELEAALRRLKGETFCSRDWYAAFGACLELVRDGVTASETTVEHVEPSVGMKNVMRAILGHDPLPETPLPDNAWLCVCGLVVKKRYQCLCGGREDNSDVNRTVKP